MDSVFFSSRRVDQAKSRISAVLDDFVHDFDYQKGTQALILLAGILVAHRLVVIIYNVWLHPLSKFPGPTHMAAIYMPYLYHNFLKGDMPNLMTELHQKYGPVVRVGPNHIAADGSVGWPSVYAHKPGKEEFGKVPGYFTKTGDLSIIGGPKDVHRRQRRQLGHAFSEASVKEKETMINKYIYMLLEKFREKAASGQTIDFAGYANFITFDIIGDLTYSEPFYCLEKDSYHYWVKGIFDGVRGGAKLRFLKHYPFLKAAVDAFGLSADVKSNTRNRGYANERASKRMGYGEQRYDGHRDFISYMVKENRDGEPGLPREEILASVAFLMIAGSETTATALSGLMFNLYKDPAAYKLVTEEIRCAFSAEEDITFQSTAKLPYLHACLEETLRIYPPIAETPTRQSPGALVEDKYVPAGAYVSVYQWATYRNPNYFVDPEKFHPERWLPESHSLYDARFKNDNRAVFKPFSVGPRDCIGKNFAYAEMRLIASKFLYQFDFEMGPEMSSWMENQRSFVVWDKGPLNMRLTRREIV